MTTIVDCAFSSESNNTKFCEIEYGSEGNYLPVSSERNSTVCNNVRIHLPSLNYYGVQNYYRIRANDGVNAVTIVGTFTGTSNRYHDYKSMFLTFDCSLSMQSSTPEQ